MTTYFEDTTAQSYSAHEMQHIDQQRLNEQPSMSQYQQYPDYVYLQDTSYQSGSVPSSQDQGWVAPGHSNSQTHAPPANAGYPNQQSWEQASLGLFGQPHTETDHQPKLGTWWPWRRTKKEKFDDNLAKQFNGQRGFDGHFFYRPTQSPDTEQGHVAHGRPNDYGGSVKLDLDGKNIFVNKLGQQYVKYSDVAVYLSPTNFRPKRLVVQSADYILRNRASAGGDWRRKEMNGDIPLALRLAEWGLKPFQRGGAWSKVIGSLRMLTVAVPLQLLLAFPGTSLWEDENVSDSYTDFPGYQWDWPKYAINPLDQRPGSTTSAVVGQRPSSRTRTLRPRKLYVLQSDGSWTAVDDPPKDLQYVFISHAKPSFRAYGGDTDALVRSMAQEATLRAGCTACWLDTDCIDPVDGYQKNADIHGMCDVIRGSKRVVVIFPDNSVESRRLWGSRMWTLPEALLAPGTTIDFLARVGDKYEEKTLSLIEMTGEIWDDRQHAEAGGIPTRLLAEHFAGELTLSRIEFFVNAVEACYYRSKMNYKMFTPNDVTLAVMGLFHYRLESNNDDTPFQSLAQLSLSNDSDRIIERMVSLLHPTVDPTDSLNPFYKVAHKDVFSTRLWDIQPTCNVVGVSYEDNTLLLDSCRVMHIRWKGFPRIATVRDYSVARVIATIFITAGTWWFLQGIYIAITYTPFIVSASAELLYALKWAIGAFFFLAVFLSLFGPASVRRLYGGQVLQSATNLVGFEGVIPIDQLERLIFGTNDGRLTYEASSTPISMNWRDHDRRVGKEPDWVKDGRPEAYRIPDGHRLFTLVDTGSLTVSIFSAERPPTVALLCGHEGGMLRAVLCSWQFENNCLFKETVIRMPTNVSDAANLQGWLKVCLTTMNQHRNIERKKWSGA
ncbi:hypothetical protein E0Z10_g858 [Xylaria hypoxylon]|uniref:Heterokaryon incompatibility domain-containing protein n=1 Tax=Xylaria hypoxylon TaxID=37992 RepID=A0A4Z0ZAG7_9PEZI|nr:hypothetical protein E0Z10_g858 [Xylaria hypoxylon]